MKSTQLYDFTLAAGGSQVILADANFYKILTATGDLKITRDGGSTVRPMRAGRGEREVEFKSLIVTDISGAPNSGTIVVGDSNFIDDTIVLSSAINVRPEVGSGFFTDNSAAAANTAITIFTPASNTNGVIILNAEASEETAGTACFGGFIAHTSAPANTTTGENIASLLYVAQVSGGRNFSAKLNTPALIAAGKGLYYLASAAPSTNGLRSARWKNL
jgi:hypothetical protein